MINNALYEKYHENIKPQKRVITESDFTYKNTLSCIMKYIPSKGNVLDIGSATGTIAFFFANKGLKVDGIELSKNAVKFANLNNKKFGFKKVKFYNTSVESFKSNKKYNLITCLEVLEHVEDDLKMLQKISKYMNKNSVLVISVPSINAPLYRLGLLSKFDREVGHLRRYSPSNIASLMKKTNIKIVKLYFTEGMLRSLLYTSPFLSKLLRLTRINLINYFISFIDKFFLYLFSESQIILIGKIK